MNDAGQGQYGQFIDNDIERELDIISPNISSLVVLSKLLDEQGKLILVQNKGVNKVFTVVSKDN